jgi:hypothetical protein
MGKYTFIDNPAVDTYIDNYLSQVVRAIFEFMPNLQVRSILLAGSFGKGDGSVILNGNDIRPQRDFDICIIVSKNKIPPSNCVKSLQDKLRSRFCEITDKSYQLTSNQLPEISITTLENINSLPDIGSYDLKKCKVLYGEDIRPKIKWNLDDIPLRTNGRALFQKSIALIGAFNLDYITSGVPKNIETSFIRETSRAYIEICVGLCLLAKSYNSSCIIRLAKLREIYREDFKELFQKIPDLVDKIEASTFYKLDPTNNRITVDPLEYWFNTREDLGIVIQYYYSKYLGMPFLEWSEFSAVLEQRLTKAYYLPVVSSFFENKSLKITGLPLKSFNYLFNIRENIAYFDNALKKGSFSLPLLQGFSSPAIKAFATSPLILFAFNRDGKINDLYVNIALKKLRFVKQFSQHFETRWDEARAKFLDLVFSVNMI